MTTFKDLNLDPKVLQAVAETGYETPTPIQAQAIPHALQGRDVLGIAQTGTGKTASFTLPMITMLAKGRARARMPRSLVLCPTRELAAQVAENFETYAKHMKLSMALLIGGVSFKDQDRLIDRGVDVLIATPGRLIDHFERGKLMLNGVQIMVIDEADRMLDMGFIPDIERIFKLTPFTRQTLFFSATMAPEITRITEEFLHNPVRVEVARQATTSETITQAVCMHKPTRKDRSAKDKRDILRMLIDSEGETLTNAIIFCNRKRDVDIVAKSLKKHGHDASPLHGDLDQSLRTKILSGFREGNLKLLVASDVAARGLDIPNVSHVFNFDVPIHAEDYVHRIGRTGRAGREGKAITLCLPSDEKYLSAIENLVKQEIPRIDSPLKREERAPRPKPEPKPAPKAKDEQKPANPPQKQEGKPVDKLARQQNSNDNRRQQNDNQNNNHRQQQRGRGRGRNNGPAVQGMGEHMPEFMTRDLRALQEASNAKRDENRAKQQARDEERAAKEKLRQEEEGVQETIIEQTIEIVSEEPEQTASVDAVDASVEQPEVKEKKRRTRKPAAKKKLAEVTETEVADADDANVDVEEKPAKKPRRKPAKKKAKVEPDAETPDTTIEDKPEADDN